MPALAQRSRMRESQVRASFYNLNWQSDSVLGVTMRCFGCVLLFVLLLVSCGGGSSSGDGGGITASIPSAPLGLTATPGNAQVSLTWSASNGATSYFVKRSTTSGSGYTTLSSPALTSYLDTGLTNGTPYYYVVSAVNTAGESADSSQASATPGTSSGNTNVTVNVLSNRHQISPYVYGGAYPVNLAAVTDGGLSLVRWGGDATSTYNWQTQTYNADNDFFFDDFQSSGFGLTGDSIQFIQQVKSANSAPLMTMPMLPWAAKSVGWSFSVAKYGAQCHVNPYNTDAGDGIVASSTCDSAPTYLTADPKDAYVPLLDDHADTCPAGPPCVYRSDWAAALAAAFGSAPHFYDMDNEIDIWGSTHRDIHPAPSGYEELRDTYLAEARALKTWDPQAIRLGPVVCCWWFYFNGANYADKGNHAGVDFTPWWLNEVYWRDQIDGTKSLDVFDIHAYPDAPYEATLPQQQALAARVYRDYWDPSYVSESTDINQIYATQIQPNRTIPFRLPRMRAIVNMIYPDIPLAVTEWSAEIAGAADFSTALGDADAYGILGRERVYIASRWEAPLAANPNYQALKLYTNYDGRRSGFAPISVSATNSGVPDLFSSYAAVNAAGTSMTLLIANKDPQNTVQTQISLNGFTASQVSTYALLQSAPNTITASAAKSWPGSFSFPPYSVTMLVIGGTTTSNPAVQWDLNPDTIMVPAGGTVTLSPKIVSGTGSVTLGAPQFDSGITVSITDGSLTANQNGSILVTAGSAPGFYHYSVPGTDSSATTVQSGYIIVGNPPATFSKTGDAQSGTVGSRLASPLTVTLAPGSSGGLAAGASVLFSTNSGTLTAGSASGPKVIAVTNNAGVASVTLTLPSVAGAVHVTAEGQYGLGHPVSTFTETAH